MSFTTPAFFALLLPAVALFYLLPARWRPQYLLALSYAIYCTWSPRYLALLILATLAVHLVGSRLVRATADGARRRLLALGVASLCAVLMLFKVDAALGPTLRLPELVMPLGLSYYFFRLLSYLIEVYWDPAAHEPDLPRFAAWVAFFPQIVSGPIQRAGEFLPQLAEPPFVRGDGERVEHGVWLILCGLFQKMVIADRLALFVAEVDAHPEGYARAILVAASWCYTLQLFADFAGFTTLVIGIAELFGIESPPNFNHPFAAPNIQEFWRRWHMSLTRWLGDYVFTPLRMRLRSLGNRGLVASIMTNMILIGLWHGLSASYLAFGVIHGVFMSVSALTLRRRDRFFARHARWRPLRLAVGMVVTFNLVSFAQIFFRAATFADAVRMLRLIARPLGARALPAELALPTLVCATTALAAGSGLHVQLWRLVTRGAAPPPRWAAYAVGMLGVVLLASAGGGQFIYFKF